MSDEVYWKKRAESIANLQFDKTDSYILELDLEYKKALDGIQKEIDAIYKNHDINNMVYNAKMARLQELKAQINSSISSLYENQQKDLTDFLGDIYKDTYYRNVFEIFKGLGIGVNFVKIDNKAIGKVLKEPWNGSNYSDRIWRNKQILIKELQSNLTQSFIRGDSIDKTSKTIANKMNVGKAAARRLVNTESAYITSKATLEGYSNSGVVKQYEILATLDLHTSKICRYMDGKVFKVSEKKMRINAPPFHPNCRTTTIAYFDDAVDEERIARDYKGNNYKVAGNVTYDNWYKEHVANNPEALIEEKKVKNKSSDKEQYEEYKKVLGNMIPKKFDDFQNLKYNSLSKWEELKNNFKIVNAYKIDFGYVEPQKILELDKVAFETKTTKFDYTQFSGKDRKDIKNLARSGNFAVMEFEGEKYFAHSSIALSDENKFKSFAGNKGRFVLWKEKQRFRTMIINNIPREFCTEAKFFEFLNDNIDNDYNKEITILSEMDMCDSCRGVLEQFKVVYPKSNINIVSGKEGINWRRRK